MQFSALTSTKDDHNNYSVSNDLQTSLLSPQAETNAALALQLHPQRRISPKQLTIIIPESNTPPSTAYQTSSDESMSSFASAVSRDPGAAAVGSKVVSDEIDGEEKGAAMSWSKMLMITMIFIVSLVSMLAVACFVFGTMPTFPWSMCGDHHHYHIHVHHHHHYHYYYIQQHDEPVVHPARALPDVGALHNVVPSAK